LLNISTRVADTMRYDTLEEEAGRSTVMSTARNREAKINKKKCKL